MTAPLPRRQFLQQATTATLAAAWTSAAGPSLAAETNPSLIVDCHQHLWDLNKFRLPWLEGAPAILKQTYHIPEYRAATAGLTMRSIYMEVHVDAQQLDAEADHVIELSRSGTAPTVAAVIGSRPESPQFLKYIERFKGSPVVKGVRRVLHEADTPPGFCLGEQFVKSVQRLGELGLSFDLCLRPTDLADGLALSEKCPDTRFILDHCGNCDLKAFRPKLDTGKPAAHTADDFKRIIERLAKRPNVICKISGIIAELPAGGDAEDLAPVINTCLDTFGPDRVVFGSDWPVCLLGRPLLTWVTFLKQIIATRPAEEQAKLWSGNATKYYGLKPA
ncbi:MAG TPA: amidohydrolase family protein [Planctomycetaceae bacterium]|jgi:predicted TIM-barrel fold metal-dependent hydrolase|nr:amidohydrolase family protein [Planctomycetaceae bacterium]